MCTRVHESVCSMFMAVPVCMCVSVCGGGGGVYGYGCAEVSQLLERLLFFALLAQNWRLWKQSIWMATINFHQLAIL